MGHLLLFFLAGLCQYSYRQSRDARAGEVALIALFVAGTYFLWPWGILTFIAGAIAGETLWLPGKRRQRELPEIRPPAVPSNEVRQAAPRAAEVPTPFVPSIPVAAPAQQVVPAAAPAARMTAPLDTQRLAQLDPASFRAAGEFLKRGYGHRLVYTYSESRSRAPKGRYVVALILIATLAGAWIIW